jgi:hypothetical protein
MAKCAKDIYRGADMNGWKTEAAGGKTKAVGCGKNCKPNYTKMLRGKVQ